MREIDKRLLVSAGVLASAAALGAIFSPQRSQSSAVSSPDPHNPAAASKNDNFLQTELSGIDFEMERSAVLRPESSTAATNLELLPDAAPQPVEVTERHADGSIKAQGQTLDGKPHGRWTHYHENGGLHQYGSFDKGEPLGTWYKYDKNGLLDMEYTFEDGKFKATLFDPLTGQVIKTESRDTADPSGQDKLSGPQEEFYSDGNIKAQGKYVSGNKDGVWSTWYEDGALKSQGVFQAGEKTGYWSFWNSDGSLNGEHSGWYNNGQISSH